MHLHHFRSINTTNPIFTLPFIIKTPAHTAFCFCSFCLLSARSQHLTHNYRIWHNY